MNTAYRSDLRLRTSDDAADSLLVRQFRSFYAELTTMKRQVLRDSYVPQADTDLPEEDAAAVDIQQRLTSLLESQENTVRRQGGEALAERYRLVQYAMVALADEIFLNIDWKGRDYWYDHLLESRQFDSQNAGVRVFEIVDRVLGQRSDQADVATVYLYVLVLGFEGQYREASDSAPLDEYRERLFQYLQRQNPDRLEESTALSPTSYRHTLDQGQVELLPDLRWWMGSFVAVGVLYLIGSTALWWWYTDDLAELAQQILAVT